MAPPTKNTTTLMPKWPIWGSQFWWWNDFLWLIFINDKVYQMSYSYRYPLMTVLTNFTRFFADYDMCIFCNQVNKIVTDHIMSSWWTFGYGTKWLHSQIRGCNYNDRVCLYWNWNWIAIWQYISCGHDYAMPLETE